MAEKQVVNYQDTSERNDTILLEINGVLYEISENKRQDVVNALSGLSPAKKDNRDDAELTYSIQSVLTEAASNCTQQEHAEMTVVEVPVSGSLTTEADHVYHSIVLEEAVDTATQAVTATQQPDSSEQCTVLEVPVFTEEAGPIGATVSALGTSEQPDFEILPTGSNRGKPLLIDSSGYSYNIKSTKNLKTYWQCSKRNKSHGTCPGIVNQTLDGFTPGRMAHDHPGNPEMFQKRRFASLLKMHAVLPQNSTKSAANVVKDFLASLPYDLAKARPAKFENLERKVNRLRQLYRQRGDIKKEEDSDIEEPIENVVGDATTLLPASELATPDSSTQQYEIIPSSLKKGVPLLADVKGFSYTLKKQIGGQRYWQCLAENRGCACAATVVEDNGAFREVASHSHAAQPEKQLRRKIKAELQSTLKAFRNGHPQADLLIEEVLAKVMQKNPQCQSRLAALRKWSQKHVPQIVAEFDEALQKSAYKLAQEKTVVCSSRLLDDLPELEVIPYGSAKGYPILVQKNGHCYTLKSKPGRRNARKYWHCQKRSRSLTCPATIIEFKGTFSRGTKDHVHPSNPKQALVVRVAGEIRRQLQNPESRFEDPALLVQQAMHKVIGSETQIPKSQIAHWRKIVRRGQMQMFVQTPIMGSQLTEVSMETDDIPEDDTGECDDSMDVDDDELLEGTNDDDDDGDDGGMDDDDSDEQIIEVKIEPCDDEYEENPTQQELNTSPVLGVVQPASPSKSGITYMELPNGTVRGNPMLIDSLGFSYTRKCGRANGRWICSVRNNSCKCPARVTEIKGQYTRSIHEHIHPGTPGKNRRLMSTPKECELKPVSVMAELKKMKGQEPTELNFEISMSFIPEGFLKKDLHVGAQRHVILATEQQIEAMQSAKFWYVDCFTKPVKPPFVNLLSIHTHMKKAEEIVYVPLAFVLMTRCKKKDYKKIFQTLQLIIAESSPMKKIVATFDKPLWHALWKVWPDVPVFGSPYHWQGTIWAKIEEMGLKPIYNRKGPTYNYLLKVLALLYVPDAHIPVVFSALQAQAGGEQLEKLLSYIDITWITDTTWPVSAWCAYNKPMRLRSEVEGWLPYLKTQNPGLPFYVLIKELYNLSVRTKSGLEPVTKKKLVKHLKTLTDDVRVQLFKEWDNYMAGNCTATQLLSNCSRHVAL